MVDIKARTEEFTRAGNHLARMDKPIQNALRRELRAAGKPVGEKALSAIADAMPERGGLAEKIREQGRASVVTNLRKGVTIRIANRTGIYMEAFEKGLIRHPVYGTADRTRMFGKKLVRQWRWEAQTVPGGKGAEVFTKEAPALAEKVAKATTDAFLREVSK